jgi:hypothetical protein
MRLAAACGSTANCLCSLGSAALAAASCRSLGRTKHRLRPGSHTDGPTAAGTALSHPQLTAPAAQLLPARQRRLNQRRQQARQEVQRFVLCRRCRWRRARLARLCHLRVLQALHAPQQLRNCPRYCWCCRWPGPSSARTGCLWTPRVFLHLPWPASALASGPCLRAPRSRWGPA